MKIFPAFIAFCLLCGPYVGGSTAQTPQPDDEEQRITLLVPAGAGGGTDALARRLAVLLSEPLEMPIAVVNRPGEQGRAMVDALRSAQPDGLTLGLLTGQAFLGTADRAAALTPILLVNHDPPTLHVRAGDDPGAVLTAVFAGAARASGGAAGSLWHLSLARVAQANRQSLPGRAWEPMPSAAAAIDTLRDGGLRLVVAEAGQGDAGRHDGQLATFEVDPGIRTLGGWRGLVAPPGLSNRRAEAIARATRLVAGSNEFRTFLESRGYAPADLGPADFRDFLAAFEDEVASARAALD